VIGILTSQLFILGGQIRQTGGFLTFTEKSQKVYRHLLAHPELRQGPIGEIMLDALRKRLMFVDKSGQSYESEE
jgi:hypothetical protein